MTEKLQWIYVKQWVIHILIQVIVIHSYHWKSDLSILTKQHPSKGCRVDTENLWINYKIKNAGKQWWKT